MNAYDRLDQPAGSKIVFEPRPNGLTLNVPPRIASGTRSGLVLLSLFFAVLLLPSTVWALRNFAVAARFALALAFAWFADTELMLVAVCMGRSRAVLAVANGELLVVEKGMFSSSRASGGKVRLRQSTSGHVDRTRRIQRCSCKSCPAPASRFTFSLAATRRN